MTSTVRVRRIRGSHWVLVGVLLVLAGLSAWGVRARVPVYAVAVHTPLALDPALQVVVTPVAGQVRVTHLQIGREVQAGEWRTRLAQHQREVVVLEGDLAVATARLARLAYALEDTKLRASSAGRLGAVAALLPGTVVQAGTWLGVLG